jgi:small-conductance mechanosensitive channel
MLGKAFPSTRGARWAIASRMLAALFGGYVLAYALTAFAAVYLPMARADRVVFASLASFAVWTAAVIYVFAAATAWRAWGGLLVTAGLLGLAVLLAGQFGVRP